MDLIRDNLPLVAIIVVLLLVAAFLLLRPRQRVRLTDSAPVRPHMASRPRSREGGGVAGEAAAAASDVAGEVIGARVHHHLSGASAAADDLQRLKGVGPKFAQLLHAQGITRYEQLAKLTPAEVDRLDAVLGPFRGRIARDRLVEQADYLARGDEEGFQERFGRL